MTDLWRRFQERYPSADFSKFKTEGFSGIPNVMYYENGEGTAVFDDAGKDFRPSAYFSKSAKKALGLPIGFPLELTFNPDPKSGLGVPSIPFGEKPRPISGKLINQEIYVTPSDHFNVKFRDIFTETEITHYAGSESRRWLASPDMGYWPQQLNFALWCATAGCGVSYRLLFQDKMADGIHDVTDTELSLPPQVRAFLWFHVYFTIRRILFQLGGIQDVSALPGDPTFSKTDNKYDFPSYKRICNEFGIHPSTDFRFIKGDNHGLGSVYIWIRGPYKTGYEYPDSSKFGWSTSSVTGFPGWLTKSNSVTNRPIPVPGVEQSIGIK